MRKSVLRGVAPDAWSMGPGIGAIWVVEGRCGAVVGAQTLFEAKAGDVIVVAEPVAERWKVAAQGSDPVELLALSSPAAAGGRAQPRRLGREDILHDPTTLALDQALRHEAKAGDPRLVHGLLQAFLCALRLRADGGVHRDPIVKRTLELVVSDWRHNWKIPELAKAAGLSRAGFARHFRGVTGEAPERYLTGVRLQYAAELLVSEDLGLSGVAREVGYRSEFAFSRAFKRRFGIAPGMYRKQARALAQPSRILLRGAA